MALTKIQTNDLAPSLATSISQGGGPKISNVQIANSSWSQLDDTAVDTNGGYLIINGSGFVTGCSVIVGTTTAAAVAFANSSQLRVTVAAANAATYPVYVVNPDGGTATKINGLTYSGSPIWVTNSTLANAATSTEYSYQLDATGATSYALQSGSLLPSNATLNANGLLIGTTTVVTNTSYSFTVVATDDENQDSDRTFSLNVNNVVPAENIEILVVAGGGTGGLSNNTRGAGGGAGGLIHISSFPVSTGVQYTATVGSGGNSSSGTQAQNGANSTFIGNGRTLTAIGGGHGGYNDNTNNGAQGGSGGGQWYPGYTGASALQPSTTNDGIDTYANTGFGNKGGDSYGNQPYGSGGGGAGAAGGNYNGPNGPVGGIGKQYDITGTATYYAGGGGSGAYPGQAGYAEYAGGLGGGGTGSNDSYDPISNGGTNTGGGGGSGGSGGSGIIVLRYPTSYLAATSTTGTVSYSETGGYHVYQFTGNGTITF